MAHLLDIDRPLPETLQLIAREKGVEVRDVTVMMLKRDRHKEAVEEIRAAGARIRFISHGDVSAALLAVQADSPVDLLWGIGGTPEGVISAAALKCVGGEIQARLRFRNDDERARAKRMGVREEDFIYSTEDLAKGHEIVPSIAADLQHPLR